ncbi:hypothetical protein F5144DRAFT_622802 [Chaetomium tenue]|uniref:Uncharacterized protein n=1 Tax=Chaetomium tenue TaxID=1854479 RepID=A0ACB7P0V1_9PEZI|nr:hypothetical protein F5144DRAFT_622802 [Chaetomium globosum]
MVHVRTATSACNRSNPNENSRPSTTDRRDTLPIPQIDRSAGLGLPIVAPIHLVENHPLGSPRGGVWGMNTPTTPHTPLEKLLLFVTIAGILQSNNLIKDDDTFDAQRLNPESLRDLFLRLLREEVRAESENTLGPDGALSPASKKRKLQSPPPLTLKDARQHVGKLESAYDKIYDAYLSHAADEIRNFEEQYDELDGEIKELEKLGTAEPDTGPKPPNPQGAPAAGKHELGPSSRVPVSSASQQALRNLQPNGISPLQPAAPERASSAPRPSAPAHPEPARSPQLGQQEVSRVPATKPTAAPKSQNTAPQVLQAPQGVTPFQPPQSPVPPAAGDGLQRPESAPGARQSPSLPGNVLPAQGQLKWEPPYQPNTPWRHPQQQQQQHYQQQPSVPNPPSQPMPSSRGPQQPAAPHPSSVAIQGQTTRPSHPQQVLIPPHSTAQFAAPLQSPQVRPPADSTTEPGRQQPLHPTAAASNTPQPQSPYVPPYQGHPVPTPGPATPIHPISQVHPPSPSRAAAIPAAPTPSVAVPPRPSPGLAAPQQPQHPAALQPPSYNQQHAPRGGPSPAPGPPDAGQRYSSPYQPPRPAAVDRIHPRFPVTSTPTRAAKFSPAPSAPQTPTMTLPTRLAKGSGTKWVSNSTPSTPKPGIEFRLGYDDVPSPAYEPTSPVLRPSAPPVLKQAPKREGPTETPKHKPGRQQASQRPQGISTPQPGPRPTAAVPAPSQVKQAAAESEPPRSVTGRPHPARSTKRKREELTPTPGRAPRASQLREALSEGLNPADPPKLVLWTRSFNKVCGSAMEQIVHHRSANMFAAPIREKDAPGYHKVVKQAQDLKTIRAAISHGNRAAAQAAAALPDGADQGSSSGVWLPRTHDLMPPKSIINSSQLDRELAHMFSNAVMYNPDPHHGPGPAFLRPEIDEDEEVADADAGGGGGGSGGGGGGGGGVAQDSGVLGYKVDEFGVVNDARAMFVEVEKLLSELRSAEVRRNVPPGGGGGGGGATGTGTSKVGR